MPVKLELPGVKELRREKIVIPAFFDDELEAVAKRLGVYNDLVAGKTRCAICGREVNLDNLGAFMKMGDGVKVVCDNPVCIAKAVRIAIILSGKAEC